MSKNLIFIFSLVILLISCDKAVNSVEEKSPTALKTKTIAINEAGYEFSINWPDELSKQGINPEIKYNETSGILEINAGEKIQIEVTDEAMGLEEIKKELEELQMFTYKFQDETPEGYIFQAVLPDGTSYFYNFLEQKTIGDKTYLFKNRDNGEYTLDDVKMMKKIAASGR